MMRVENFQVAAPDALCFSKAGVPVPDNDEADVSSSFIDPVELESLGLILEFSLKVHTPHQFYCWTQGVLQNLIRHELLICALRKGESSAVHVDSFSTTSTQSTLINSLFSQDTSLVPLLMKAWENNQFQPVVLDIRKEKLISDSALARELNRIEASEVLVHGTHDSYGKFVSLFIFASRPGTNARGKETLVKLLVPTLHSAWVHTQLIRPTMYKDVPVDSKKRDALTPRELDILNWIYRGKSNIEIGLILGLSPFTVKNHVQKILRRLNVLNRAQAVGKALALRLFDGAAQV
jgi:transcriptional regulator EpsA